MGSPQEKRFYSGTVTAAASLTKEIFRLECRWKGPAPQPGQFFMLKPERSGVFLPRPVSAAGWKPGGTEESTLSFLIALRGRGTEELAVLQNGETIVLSGPLGNSWENFLPGADSVRRGRKPLPVALIGGGIGIAPLLPFAEILAGRGAPDFDFYAGFRSAAFGLEALDAGAGSIIIASEDGSTGRTALIPDLLEPGNYAAVYACGPEAMIRAVAERCKDAEVPCYVSLERRMACGAGACLGCTVETGRGNKRCCADGPIFPAEEVFFDRDAAATIAATTDAAATIAVSPVQKNPAADGTMQTDLSVTIAGVQLRNPVIAASGTFGYGGEYAGLLDIAGLGGICTKGLTLKGRPGNTGVRLHETPSGLLNSIGLENPGIPAFLEQELPRLRRLGPAVIANLSGSDMAGYAGGASLLDSSSIDMIELNISCPNVKAGGMQFGLDPSAAAEITAAVRKAAAHKPLMVKLSPNAPDLAAVALSCVNAGADAVSLVNTFKAMAIDIKKRQPVFDNITAGLSGPAIKPIALRMVWELREILDSQGFRHIPVIGMGGIASAGDALEFLLAGAIAVEVGSATFTSPRTMNEIISGIKEYLEINRFHDLHDVPIRR